MDFVAGRKIAVFGRLPSTVNGMNPSSMPGLGLVHCLVPHQDSSVVQAAVHVEEGPLDQFVEERGKVDYSVVLAAVNTEAEAVKALGHVEVALVLDDIHLTYSLVVNCNPRVVVVVEEAAYSYSPASQENRLSWFVFVLGSYLRERQRSSSSGIGQGEGLRRRYWKKLHPVDSLHGQIHLDGIHLIGPVDNLPYRSPTLVRSASTLRTCIPCDGCWGRSAYHSKPRAITPASNSEVRTIA
jgi:hypothetical protein